MIHILDRLTHMICKTTDPTLRLAPTSLKTRQTSFAMAARTHKTNRVQSEAHIRKLLAKTHHQHTKSVSFERSPFTPEACAHERISTQEPDSTLLSDEDEREREQRVTPNPSASVNSDAEQASVKSDAAQQLLPLNPSTASTKDQDVSSDAHVQDLSTCFQQGITLKRDEPVGHISPFAGLRTLETTSLFDGIRLLESHDSPESSPVSDPDDRKPAAKPSKKEAHNTPSCFEGLKLLDVPKS